MLYLSSILLLFLWCGMIRMGAIMVIAITLLLVIVVGQRQRIKRSGSILINCHWRGMAQSRPRAAAEPALCCTLSDGDWLLLCSNLHRGRGIIAHAAWIRYERFICPTPPLPLWSLFAWQMIERPLVSPCSTWISSCHRKHQYLNG